jgi:hypothetical protein
MKKIMNFQTSSNIAYNFIANVQIYILQPLNFVESLRKVSNRSPAGFTKENWNNKISNSADR